MDSSSDDEEKEQLNQNKVSLVYKFFTVEQNNKARCDICKNNEVLTVSLTLLATND